MSYLFLDGISQKGFYQHIQNETKIMFSEKTKKRKNAHVEFGRRNDDIQC